MKNQKAKTYVHDGKTITIIPAKRVKKEASAPEPAGEKAKPAAKGRTKKSKAVEAPVKYEVGDKVGLKNIPTHLAAAGFGQAVVIKVFKSTVEEQYRYSIRSSSGQELALLQPEELVPRK